MIDPWRRQQPEHYDVWDISIQEERMNRYLTLMALMLILGVPVQAQEEMAPEPEILRYEVIGRVEGSDPPVPITLILSFTERIYGTTETGEFRTNPHHAVLISEWLVGGATFEWRIGIVAQGGRFVWAVCLPGVRNAPCSLRLPPGTYRNYAGVKNTQDFRINFGPLWRRIGATVDGIPLDK